jgi:ABC-type polar amino acid transport system ATPase subunit
VRFPPIEQHTPVSVLELESVSKQYGALRPLRVAQLTVTAGEQIAIVGFDQPAAEVFISLVMGAAVPDTGTVRAFGKLTTDIADSTEWLGSLDRFGIVSDRAPLLDMLSVVQNLSMPFSLEIEPPAPDVRARAEALARDVGLDAVLEQPVGSLGAGQKLRVRLARAIALEPGIVILEHPSATLGPSERNEVARDMHRVIAARRIAAITLTMDRDYAASAAATVLTLDPANGRLSRGLAAKLKFWSR